MAIDVKGRLAKAMPQDMVRGCMYNALFGVVRLSSASAVSVLDPLGRGEDRPAFQEYPISAYLPVLASAAELLARDFSSDEAFLVRVGREAIRVVSGTPMAAKVLEKARGRPEELVKSFQESSRPLLVGYGSRTLEWRGPREARIHYRRGVLPAALHSGMYAAMLEFVGAAGVAVTHRELAEYDQELDVSWSGVTE